MGVLDDENADRGNRNSTADRDRQGSGNVGSSSGGRSSGGSSGGSGRGVSEGTTAERESRSTGGSTGYGEGSSGRNSTADRDRQGAGNVASDRPTSTSTGYGAGGSRSPGYTAAPTATTPSPSRSTTTTTGLGTGFDPSRFGPTVTTPVATRGLGNGLTPEERALIGRSGVDLSASAFLSPMPVSEGTQAERARRLATTSAVRIDPSAALMNLSLQAVAGLENYANVDPYHGVFGKKAGNPALTTMTLGEVKAYQKTLKNTPVGAYQMTDDTLKVAARLAGVTDSTVMTKAVWDRMGAALVADRARRATGKDGKIDVNKFATELSKEWAALADPKTGRSHYHGTAGNKARAGVDVTMELANDFALALENGAATAVAAAAPVAAAATTRYDEVYSGKGRSALPPEERVDIYNAGLGLDLPPGTYSDPAAQYVDPYAAVRQPAGVDPYNAVEPAVTEGVVPSGPGRSPTGPRGLGIEDRIALPATAPIDERALINSTQLPSGSYRDPVTRGLQQPEDLLVSPEPAPAAAEDIEIPASDYDLTTKEGIKDFQRDHGLKDDGIIGPLTRAAIENSPDLPSEGDEDIPDIDPMTTGAVGASVPAGLTFKGQPMTQAQYDRLTPDTKTLLGNLVEIRGSVNLNSAKRTATGNREAKGARKSQHLGGNAIDWDISGLTNSQKTQAVIDARQAGANRIIAYSGQTALHLDMLQQAPKEGYDVYAMFDKSADNMHRAPEWYKEGLRADVDRTYIDPDRAAAIEDAATTHDTAAATTPDGTVHAAPNAAADAAARAATAHAPANTTAGPGYYSNITQRGLSTNLKPTVPPTGVSAEDYKRGLGGHVGAAGIDMLIGGSVFGTVGQVISLLTTGNSIGGNVVDNIAGQGRTNYYQPGDLDRRSDSSGEVARTSAIPTGPVVTVTGDGTTTTATTTGNASYEGLPTFESKYLGDGATTPSTYPTPTEAWGLDKMDGGRNAPT